MGGLSPRAPKEGEIGGGVGGRGGVSTFSECLKCLQNCAYILLVVFSG